MSSDFVVDANVVVKVVAPEPLSGLAAELLAPPRRVLAPAHCLAEILEVLHRKYRAGMIDGLALLRAPRILASRIECAPLAELAPLALRIAGEARIAVYDAFYVALAVEADLPLVTADEKLIRALADSDHERHVCHLASAREAGLMAPPSL